MSDIDTASPAPASSASAPASAPAPAPAADPPVFLTTAELCARWKVSVMFLWRLRQEGRLHACKLGTRRVRYALAHIEQIETEFTA